MEQGKLGLLTSDKEGFPNVVLQMLPAGISHVISTDCAGDLGKVPGVHVASDKTPDALAQLLVRQMNQPSDEKEVEKFLRERSVKKYLSILLDDCA